MNSMLWEELVKTKYQTVEFYCCKRCSKQIIFIQIKQTQFFFYQLIQSRLIDNETSDESLNDELFKPSDGFYICNVIAMISLKNSKLFGLTFTSMNPFIVGIPYKGEM